MHFQRYYLGCLAHASYLIGDEETKIAAVVDPQRDIDQYLRDAREKGFTIKHVILTHFHADFVAGHIELRDKVGATIYLGAKAQAEYPFTPARDGGKIEFGQVRIEFLETPGHTPESISLLIFDLGKNSQAPQMVLTGDTLFIGDVGRPDLLASIGVTAEELADMLYDSLTNKLLKLPDETLVYPAHGAGSMCGKQLGKEAYSTIGEQKRYNYALQPMSREDFKRLVTADQPEAPEYFVHDAILNRQERPSLDKALEAGLKPLTLAEVLAWQNQKAQIVDTRRAVDFAGAHLKGSLNIGLEGKYATWAGTVLRKDLPIVVIADSGREEESVLRLGRIGFDKVVGYLKGGVGELADRPDLMAQTPRITAPAVADWQKEGPGVVIVDVRTPAEWNSKHIEGSLNIPLNQLEKRLGEIPGHRPLVLHCQGGYRSSLAASLLERQGLKDMWDMVGGFEAWEASHLPFRTEAKV